MILMINESSPRLEKNMEVLQMEEKSKHAKCPKCGNDNLTKRKRGWTITTGVFGMNKMQYQCHDCGHKFMENKADYS